MNDLEVRKYLGSGIAFKNINGQVYANATDMAKCFEGGLMKLANWKRSDKTKELIVELNEINDMQNLHIELIISDRGGLDSGGTFIHESLVIDFAQYLNIKFKVWCNLQITTLIRNGFVSIKPISEESMLLELFPNTDSNLILLTANTIRDNKILTIKIKEDAPKVNFADRITNSSDAIDIGSFVKVLHDENIKIGRNIFFEWLRTNKYLMSNNIPFQKYINNGYFKVIETVKKTVYGDKIFPKSLITGKGQLIIAEKLRIELGGK